MATSPELIDTINNILNNINEYSLTSGEVIAINNVNFNKLEDLLYFVVQGRVLTENSLNKYINFLSVNNFDTTKYTKNIKTKKLYLPIMQGITVD